MRSSVRLALVAAAAFAAAPSARAGLNDPIAFNQAGEVVLTLDFSAGGFDHILEMQTAPGSISPPIVMALTELASPSADVLGFTPAILGETASLGSFAAGEELVFRLTNVESERLGTPGTIADQTFSGTSSGNNPSPASYYTLVEQIDATTIQVYWEDLFAISPTDPDPVAAFLDGGYDVAFTLTLTPVPEPSSFALLGIALSVACALRRSSRRLR